MRHREIRSIVVSRVTELDPMLNPMARRAPASVIPAALLVGALLLLVAVPAPAQPTRYEVQFEQSSYEFPEGRELGPGARSTTCG